MVESATEAAVHTYPESNYAMLREIICQKKTSTSYVHIWNSKIVKYARKTCQVVALIVQQQARAASIMSPVMTP